MFPSVTAAYRRPKIIVSWYIAFTIIFRSLSAAIIARDQVALGAALLTCSVLFATYAAISIGKWRSKITIDSRGVSRSFLGWTWITFRWNEIKTIKVFPAIFERKFVNAYHLTQKPANPGERRERIALMFSGDTPQIQEIRQALSTYAMQYGIAIHVRARRGASFQIVDNLQ